MKLNRKLVLVLSLVLSLALATGGTLAYLTDRDSAANVFTMGNVDIELNEDFEQDSTLMPGVDIEKKPTIENTGANPAWVWATIAIPAELDSDDASKNVVHFNYSKDSVGEGLWNWQDSDGNWRIAKNVVGPDERLYNVYTVLYETALQPGEETAHPVMTKVYMDPHVDIDPDGNLAHVEAGVVTELDWNINEDGGPVIYVSAYAMQTDGFDSVEAAYEAYTTQWTTTDNVNNGIEWGVPGAVEVDATVSTSEALAEAIENGDTVIKLEAGEYTMTSAAKGKTLTLIGSGADETTITVVPAGQGEANGQLDYSFDGSTVTFEDLTIETNSQLYAGFARLSGTYNNCTIQNTYNLGTGTSEFNNCTFNITNEYLRVGGANKATFNGCTFNTDGRAILVFQDGTSVAQTVTVKDCTFNATAAAQTWNGIHVAAVSIDGTNGTYVVNLEGNNVVDSDFNGLWQIKTGEANVTVNE